MILFLYALLCLIWGSTWIGIKIGLNDAPPLYAISIRFLLAVTILYSIARFRRYRFPVRLSDFVYLGYPGLYIYGVSYALIYFAELYISSALTAILMSSLPLFVAVLSIWILREERLSLPGWIGIFIGFGGVVVIFYDSLRVSEDVFFGSVLALTGSLAAAYGSILHKRRSSQQNIVIAVLVQMAFGLAPLIAAALIFESPRDFSITVESVGSIVYLAIFGTVVAFLSYYWLLARVRVVAVSLTAFITPIVAIMIGVTGFGENLMLLVAVGTVMILSSVLLVVRAKARKV